MRPLRLLAMILLGSSPLAAMACGGGANYPDRSDVTAAQAAWCDSLVKLKAAPGDNVAGCKDMYPTASGPYLRGMTGCVAKRIEAAGDKGTDVGHVVADCDDEVIAHMKYDEAVARDLVEARCARSERCEKVPVADCKTAFGRLDSAQRVLLTVKYNAGAIHSVADCLGSASCGQDEDAAREACYKKATQKLLWFPG
jgi:hypothetical protein